MFANWVNQGKTKDHLHQILASPKVYDSADPVVTEWRSYFSDYLYDQAKRGRLDTEKLAIQYGATCRQVGYQTFLRYVPGDRVKIVRAEGPAEKTVQPQPPVPTAPTQQVSQSSGAGEFFSGLGSFVGALLEVTVAVVTPLAKGYVDQGNENARNASNAGYRQSAPNYTCISMGSDMASCTSH